MGRLSDVILISKPLCAEGKCESKRRVGGVHPPLAMVPYRTDCSAGRNRTWNWVSLCVFFLFVPERDRGRDVRMHKGGIYKRVTLSSLQVWFGYVWIHICMWSAYKSQVWYPIWPCTWYSCSSLPLSVDHCWEAAQMRHHGSSGFYYKILFAQEACPRGLNSASVQPLYLHSFTLLQLSAVNSRYQRLRKWDWRVFPLLPQVS